MPNRCSKCACEESQLAPLVHERVPFVGGMLCSACRTRLYIQIEIGSLVSGGVLFLFFWWQLPAQEFNDFVRPLVTLYFLSLFQWCLVIPHELGHAIAAKILAFKDIRIQIGYGKSFWSGSFLGFSWHFCRIPFGGITLADPDNRTPREIAAMISAGPLATALPMVAILIFFPSTQSWLPPFNGLVGLLFWAHAIVLASNLFPWQASTPFGSLQSDGLQLLNFLRKSNSTSVMQGPTHTETSSTHDETG